MANEQNDNHYGMRETGAVAALERTQTHHRIAEIMCESTEAVLWSSVREWADARRAGVRFTTRAGTGRKTYHQDRTSEMRITFGRLMVEDKCGPHAATRAPRWLGSREVAERGYFNGELTPLNLLAHTVCHEFAHAVQCLKGDRLPGSVHNEAFYRILDRLHASGLADQVRSYIARSCERQGIALPDIAFRDLRATCAEQRATFYSGDDVTFERRGGERLSGAIERCGPKRAVVRLTDGRVLRVPYAMLETIEAG